jgi:hypothetical protein
MNEWIEEGEIGSHFGALSIDLQIGRRFGIVEHIQDCG